ncbi:pentapeptide repeat-containing protein [Micromonospora chokoriensis]
MRRGTDVCRCSFGADVTDESPADVRGADVRGADVRGADVRGADVRGAEFLEPMS